MSKYLKVYDERLVKRVCTYRENETKVGQSIVLLNPEVNVQQALCDAAQFGMRFVLLGVCEDIGPKANMGKGGAQRAWSAFLQHFLNQPHNQFLAVQKVLLLGEVDVDDLIAQSELLDNQQAEQLHKLRSLCSELDERVESVLSLIFKAGLQPIVIGGGHNNCLGIIRALAKYKNTPINAINFDPHADFRECEGRHSGNGFRYAYNENHLKNYHVIGLHELKNNQDILNAMAQAGFKFTSYQAIQVARKINLSSAINNALNNFDARPLGIEVDVDSITSMPVSAYNYCGFSVNDAEHFVYLTAQYKHSEYLHLAEGAPAQHANSLAAEEKQCGQVISALVNSYIQVKQNL